MPATRLARADRRRSALSLRARRHLRRRRRRAPRSQIFQPDWVMHLAAESHVDRSIDGPGEFIQTNLVGTYVMLQAALAYWRGLPPARRKTSASTISRPTKCSARSATTACSAKTRLMRRNSPYSASKAGSDHLVRAWRHTYGLPVVVDQLLEQLRALSFPGKADSADHPQRAGGQAAAGLRRGRQRSRLAVRRGSRRGAADRRAKRAASARATTSAAINERRNIDVVHAICDLMDELAPDAGSARAATDHLRPGPARPRPALRDRLRQDRARTRLAAARNIRDRPAQDGAMVSRQPRLVGATSAAGNIAANGSARWRIEALRRAPPG